LGGSGPLFSKRGFGLLQGSAQYRRLLFAKLFLCAYMVKEKASKRRQQSKQTAQSAVERARDVRDFVPEPLT